MGLPKLLKHRCPPCSGLLLPSICWGEAFIQSFPGVVNRLRAERGVRVKGGSREKDTRCMFTHTQTCRERKAKRREMHTKREMWGAGEWQRVRKKDIQREKQRWAVGEAVP